MAFNKFCLGYRWSTEEIKWTLTTYLRDTNIHGVLFFINVFTNKMLMSGIDGLGHH